MWTANARAEKPSPSPSGTLAGAHRGSVGDSAARAAGAPSNSRGTSLIRNRFPPYDPLRTTGIGLRYGPTGWWFRMSEALMYFQSALDRTRSASNAVPLETGSDGGCVGGAAARAAGAPGLGRKAVSSRHAHRPPQGN